MNNDLIRRSDVLDFLRKKIAACPSGSPEEAALESTMEWIEVMPPVLEVRKNGK